jgi:hypothetical protein
VIRRTLWAAILLVAWGGLSAAEIKVEEDDFTGEVKRVLREEPKITKYEHLLEPRIVLAFLQSSDGTLNAILWLEYRARNSANFRGRLVSRAGDEFEFSHLGTTVLSCQGDSECHYSESLVLSDLDVDQMRALYDPNTEYKLYGPYPIQYSVSGEQLEEFIALVQGE